MAKVDLFLVEELVSDEREQMFWERLRQRGAFEPTGLVTWKWVDHAGQRHKTIREPEGGINPYRVRYRVRNPLRFHSTCGNLMDEVEQYEAMRDRPHTAAAHHGLKIRLLGSWPTMPTGFWPSKNGGISCTTCG